MNVPPNASPTVETAIWTRDTYGSLVTKLYKGSVEKKSAHNADTQSGGPAIMRVPQQWGYEEEIAKKFAAAINQNVHGAGADYTRIPNSPRRTAFQVMIQNDAALKAAYPRINFPEPKDRSGSSGGMGSP